MHDPMTVAFDIPSPIPHRVNWLDNNSDRWCLKRWRRTNDANLGEPVYPWYRLHRYQCHIAGKRVRLGSLATIWHVEPKGHDSGTICKHWVDGKHKNAWKFHFWHWHIQVHFLQRLKRKLLERCEECGRGYPWGYAPISGSWDGPGSKWRLRTQRINMHHECSALRGSRNLVDRRTFMLKVFWRILVDKSGKPEIDLLDELTNTASREQLEFIHCYDLEHLLGYKRNDNYELVKREPAPDPVEVSDVEGGVEQ